MTTTKAPATLAVVIYESSVVALKRHATEEGALAALTAVFGERALCEVGGIDLSMLQNMRNGTYYMDAVPFDPAFFA